jgi:hypothetical protein
MPASYLAGGGRGEVWSRGSTVLAGELWGAAVLAGEKLGRERIR